MRRCERSEPLGRAAARGWERAVAALAIAVTAACSSISTVRVQPESLAVGPHLRPIAIVHAQVTSAYILFFPIPGGVDLDHVVNRMLFAAANNMRLTTWSRLTPPGMGKNRMYALVT